MELQICINRQKDGDMKGKLYVHFINDSYNCKVYVSSVEQAAEEVKQFILDNCKE